MLIDVYLILLDELFVDLFFISIVLVYYELNFLQFYNICLSD